MNKIARNNMQHNPDIVEVLQTRTELENELFAQVGQLEALCSAQLTLAAEGSPLTPNNHLRFSQVLERYAVNLRKMVEQLCA